MGSGMQLGLDEPAKLLHGQEGLVRPAVIGEALRGHRPGPAAALPDEAVHLPARRRRRKDHEVVAEVDGAHAVGRRDHLLVQLLAWPDAYDLDTAVRSDRAGEVDDAARRNLGHEKLAAP